MPDVKLDRAIAAPPERVWAVITDLGGAADVMSGIDSVERLDDAAGFGVGTRWRETRTLFGRQATEILEVTAVDAGRSYTVEADGRGAHYRSKLSVRPHGEGSRLSMTFGATPRGFFSRLMAATIGRLFSRATRKAMQQDLDDIAAAAEAGDRRASAAEA